MKIPSVIAVLAMSCAPAWAQAPAAAPVKTYSSHPDGKGDPAAMTCRRGQNLPGSRMLGPEVCRTNADWAQFAKDGMDVSADGTTLVPSEKYRSLNPPACGPVQMGGGATQGNMANTGMRC
jgi:hypothetical protein